MPDLAHTDTVALANLAPLIAGAGVLIFWFVVWVIVGPIIDRYLAGRPDFEPQGRLRVGVDYDSAYASVADLTLAREKAAREDTAA